MKLSTARIISIGLVLMAAYVTATSTQEPVSAICGYIAGLLTTILVMGVYTAYFQSN